MAGFGGSVKLTGESEYRKALKQITSDLKEVDSELKLVASQYDKNDKSQEALTSQSDALSKKLEAQAKKVDLLKANYKAMSETTEQNKAQHKALKEELDNAVSELEKIEKTSGKASAEYKTQAGVVAGLTTDYEQQAKAIDSQEQALSKSRTEINKAQTEYNNTAKTLNNLTSSETDSAKESVELGKDIKSAGEQADKSAKGGFTVLKGALANLVSDGLKNAVNGIKNGLTQIVSASTEAVSSVVSLTDSIGKNSDKLGISNKAYQEWSYIFTRTGTDIEGFKGSFLKLSKAIEEGSDAFTELGISADDLKNLDKEEIFERVVKGLQNVQDQEHKSVLASKLLGKGATELGSLLQMTGEDVDSMKKRVNDLGGVLSDDAVKSGEEMKDSLTDMQTALTGVKNNIVLQFLPSIKTVVDGLTDVFTGGNIEEGFNKISEGISKTADTILNKILPNVIAMIPPLLQNGLPVLIQGIETVLKALGEQLPQLISILFGALSQVLTDLCSWLSEEGNVSELLNGILALTVDLVGKFAELLPIILPAIFTVISEIAKFMTEPSNLMLIIKSTLLIVAKVGEALIKSLPSILKIFENLGLNLVTLVVNIGSKIKEGFNAVINWVKSAFTGWLNNAVTKVNEAKANFLNKILEIKDKITGFVTNIFTTLKELPSKVVSIGSNIATGIWEGLRQKLDYLKKNIKSFGDNIIKSIKNVFKIASPSKVTKELGGYLAEGLGVGFASEMRDVNEDIKNALPTFDADSLAISPSAVTSNAGSDYYTMVNAFKEALTTVNIELDEQKVGKFVTKTVSNAIYN